MWGHLFRYKGTKHQLSNQFIKFRDTCAWANRVFVRFRCGEHVALSLCRLFFLDGDAGATGDDGSDSGGGTTGDDGSDSVGAANGDEGSDDAGDAGGDDAGDAGGDDASQVLYTSFAKRSASV